MSGAGLAQWLGREQLQFVASPPRSRALFACGERHYLYGAPMHWMRRWAGGFPLYAQRASGTRLWCADGFEHVGFCLGDSGATCGYAAPAVTAAITQQLRAAPLSWRAPGMAPSRPCCTCSCTIAAC